MNEQETHADIIAEMRMFKCRNLETGELELCNAIGNYFADRLEAALKRELSKICPKTGGDFGQLGNAAKLREALATAIIPLKACEWPDDTPMQDVAEVMDEIEKTLSAPPRNCDKVKDHSDAIGKFEKWMDFSPKTADEQDAFFKEHWFEFATWLIDMNESEAAK